MPDNPKTKKKQVELSADECASQKENLESELTALAYSVSHDLRAPLRAIDGYSKIFLEDYGDNLEAEAKRLIEQVIENAHHMGSLIDDLLRLSRAGRQPLMRVDIDMDALVHHIADGFKNKAENKNIQWKIGSLPAIKADSTLLKIAVEQLLQNAVKFSSKVNNPLVEVGAYNEKDSVVFYVKDNGIGFDMNYSDRLFGVFQKLHSEPDFSGNGIGLALAQRIIDKHKGKVWATGIPGKGATFYFSIPNKE